MDSEGAMSEPAPPKARLTLAAGWSPDHPTRRGFMRMLGAGGGVVVSGGGLVSLLEACSSTSSSTSTSTGSKQLTMAVFQEPDTLDPSASGLITVGTISECVFDHLVWKLPGHSGLIPGLAASWQGS